jgi:hypothetical protein
MRVFGIERHPTLDGMALRSHECPQCESLQTDIVSSAQGWLDRGEDTHISPISQLSLSEGFDDGIVAILGAAFEAAWQSLQVSDSGVTHEPHIASTRELLAKCILVFAKRGERDRNQLVEKALALLADRVPLNPSQQKVQPRRLPRANRRTFAEPILASSVQCPIGGIHHEQSIFWAASKRPPEK